MKIAYHIKAKNGALWQAAEKMGGVRQLAEHLGISYPTMINLMNMQSYPKFISPQSKLDWKSIEKKLLDLTGLLFDDIFPVELSTSEFIKRPKKQTLIVDVELCRLSEAAHLSLPPAQEAEIDQIDLAERVGGVLGTLKPREAKVIKMRFGLDEYNREHTCAEVGEELHVGPERIRQIEVKALRTLRHPMRSRLLRPFLESKR